MDRRISLHTANMYRAVPGVCICMIELSKKGRREIVRNCAVVARYTLQNFFPRIGDQNVSGVDCYIIIAPCAVKVLVCA